MKGTFNHGRIYLEGRLKNCPNKPIIIILFFFIRKLDRVGPMDNKPSTEKLHHFVKKEEEEKSDM